MKPLLITIGASLLIIGGAVWWSGTRQTSPPGGDTTVISTNGLHWHPELTIYVKGEQQQIPPNIGLVGGHNPMHTHEDLPIVHLEFPGVVRTSDITVKKFLGAWGKDMQSFGGNVAMTVNGEQNTELGDYVFRDGDKIELRYE